MGTIKSEMLKAGFELSQEEQERAKESLNHLKRKFKKSLCKKCGVEVQFKSVEGRLIPHDMDGTEHWQTCPYSTFTQKRNASSIIKKFGFYFLVKQPTDIQEVIALTDKEAQVVHALLEKTLKDHQLNVVPSTDPGKVIGEETEDELKEDLREFSGGEAVFDEIPFKPEPTDPVGDPDEERAPKEEEIKKESNNASE